MTYECPRCGSHEFAIDEIEVKKEVTLDVMCRCCGCWQGELNQNPKVIYEREAA